MIAHEQVEGGNEPSGAVGVSVAVSSDNPQEDCAESVLRGMGGGDGHEELVSEGEPFGRWTHGHLWSASEEPGADIGQVDAQPFNIKAKVPCYGLSCCPLGLSGRLAVVNEQGMGRAFDCGDGDRVEPSRQQHEAAG